MVEMVASALLLLSAKEVSEGIEDNPQRQQQQLKASPLRVKPREDMYFSLGCVSDLSERVSCGKAKACGPPNPKQRIEEKTIESQRVGAWQIAHNNHSRLAGLRITGVGAFESRAQEGIQSLKMNCEFDSIPKKSVCVKQVALK